MCDLQQFCGVTKKDLYKGGIYIYIWVIATRWDFCSSIVYGFLELKFLCVLIFGPN